MCFKDNKSFFKTINWVFFLVHLVLLAACIVMMVTRDKPVVLYYKIEITHDQYIDVYPIYVPFFTHAVGMLIHFIFALTGTLIVDEYFITGYTNPIRWILQFFVDGASLVGLMVIHGFHSVETVLLVLLVYIAILGFCYFEDHYLIPEKKFNPDKEPHTFAIPLHMFMIILIIGKASEHINDQRSLNIALITLVSLGLTLVSYVLQKIQIKYQSKSLSEIVEPEETNDDSDSDHGGTESDLEKVSPSKARIDRLDAILDEVRRGIQFEAYYYINSTLFAITVTWFILNITQSNQTLH